MGAYRVLAFSVVMERFYMPFFFAWFIPMQLIWLISYTTYFQDPQGDAGRDGITITCFLTMVFYQVEIKAHLPKLLCT